MIQHALTRRRGGARVTLDDFARWRDLAAQGAPATLPRAAVDAMLDPDGVTGVADMTFELESNRTGRGVATTFLPAGTLTLLDPATMTLDDLTTGRRRPSSPLAVADASYADLATAWPSTAEAALAADDEFPVGVAQATRFVVQNSQLPRPLNTNPAGQWTATRAVTSYGVTGCDPADPGRLAPAAEGFVWKAILSGGALTGYAIGPSGVNSGPYRFGPDGTRKFRVVIKIAASAAATARLGLRHVVGGNNFVTYNPTGDPAAPVFNVAAATPGDPFVRLSGIVTITGTPGTIATQVRATVILDTTVASTRVEFVDMQLYTGTAERSDAAGVLVGHPDSSLGFEQQFTGERRFNRLEVVGHDGTVPTGVYVERWDAGTASWVALAVGSGSIAFDTTVTTTGLRVYLEETAGYGGSPLLTEIDATYVAQLDGETTGGIVSASVEWSREADPAQVTSPIGNYQTSRLDLELDNTSGVWSPEANANLDVGHRITAAMGVRYTNLLGNPRADTDVLGWTRDAVGVVGSTYDRTTDPADLGDPPGDVGTAHRIKIPGLGGTITTVYSDSIPCVPGDVFDLSGWARMLLADPAAAGIVGIALTYHSSSTALGASVLTRTYSTLTAAGSTGDRWTAGQTAGVVAPANAVCVRVELSASPQASPGMTALATRMRLRKIEAGAPVVWETLVPAGVFYSDPFDWASDDDTVTITATDRLGRNADVALAEPLRTDTSVAGVIAAVANAALDLDPSQLAIDAAVAGYVLPYATPASTAGPYLADLAKCVAGTLYVDALERLVVVRRDNVTPARVAEIRDDNALIRYQRPAGYDLTASTVTLTASPLKAAAPAEVWAMPAGGIQVPPNSSKTLTAKFSSSPAVAPSIGGAIADLPGSWVITPTFYADRAELLIVNNNGVTLTLADLRVTASPLEEQQLTATAVDAASVKRYGPRTLEIDARLIQTQTQLELVAQILLDSFKALDAAGTRRLPDLVLDAMGLLHLEGGDRVLVRNPRTGLGEDFAILGRRLAFTGNGEILLSDVRVRQSPDVVFAVADLHLADDVAVAGA